MTSADMVLFRKSRGLFWGALVAVVIGLPVVIVSILVVPSALGMYSAATQAEVGTATKVIVDGVGFLTIFGAIVAILLGATAGSVDHQRGVIRDLVLAGRPRWRIVLGRLLAASAWLIIAVAVCIALLVVLAITMAPVDGDMDWGEIGRTVAALGPWLLTALVFGSGIAMLIGTRGPAIGIYLAFVFILDQILVVIPKIGPVWEHMSYFLAQGQTIEWISGTGGTGFAHSNTVALLVLIAWGVIPFTLGVIRLSNRDL